VHHAEGSKAVVRAFVEAVNAQDWDRLDDLPDSDLQPGGQQRALPEGKGEHAGYSRRPSQLRSRLTRARALNHEAIAWPVCTGAWFGGIQVPAA
jgi:hypothetical protein